MVKPATGKGATGQIRLAVSGTGSFAGRSLQLWSCGNASPRQTWAQGSDGQLVNGTRGQDWTFRPDATIRAGLFGGKCVTARGKPGAAGVKIMLWACSAGTAGQRWTVSRGGGMGSELRTGGVCLGIRSMTAANAAQLVTAACTASDPRVHWHIG